ncbi:kinetochore-associated protein DSN1 homolog [Protopterus annectens]|uniref:kinetochore-associated protein DSN1 homolog n=1 Tax=Protopterus annectens TaxID=7888 RepID=UPI001CFA98EA|nr:kinetochore-associated protein DSN1 homolog [Protopterus annectens]
MESVDNVNASHTAGSMDATGKGNLSSLRNENVIVSSPLLGTRSDQRAVISLGNRVSLCHSPKEVSCSDSVPKQLSPHKSSPRKLSPQNSSPGTSPSKGSSLSMKYTSSSPRRRRCSWRRSSLKGGRRRKSLPPVYRDVTELCKHISLELPESERLAALVQSAFQFAVQKCKTSLKNVEGFNEKDFEKDVSSVLKELNFEVEKMKREGTLQKCTEQTGAPVNPDEETLITQLKEQNARFSSESLQWNQLLQTYQNKAEEMECDLKNVTASGIRIPSTAVLQSSQKNFILNKPNYAAILANHTEIFDSIETALDEVQQCVHQVHSFMKDSEEYLKKSSQQLASFAFKELEDSPLKKCLRVRKK